MGYISLLTLFTKLLTVVPLADYRTSDSEDAACGPSGGVIFFVFTRQMALNVRL